MPTVANLFAGIPPTLAAERFDVLVRAGTVTIERIVSRGQASPAQGWYEQARPEWVLVVSGEAVLAFADGPSVHLYAGDYVDIPAQCRHRVAWTDPKRETVWLAVHY